MIETIGQPVWAIWITGLPACGKSTITRALRTELLRRGVHAAVLESDELRHVLTPSPVYSEEERRAFYTAMVGLGTLLVNQGVPVIFDATANRRAYRAEARAAIARFAEAYVECPLAVCISRDPKGIYRRARAGEAATVPGVQLPYEPPAHPDVVVSGDRETPEAAARQIVRVLEARGDLKPGAAGALAEISQPEWSAAEASRPHEPSEPVVFF